MTDVLVNLNAGQVVLVVCVTTGLLVAWYLVLRGVVDLLEWAGEWIGDRLSERAAERRYQAYVAGPLSECTDCEVCTHDCL